jgi:hypothetical protein
VATTNPLQRKLSHRLRCDDATRRDEAKREAKRELKKRHVQVVTRLPTKRMATACWAFIVAKSTALETASLLDFSSLPPSNKKNYQHLIHKVLWMSWG